MLPGDPYETEAMDELRSTHRRIRRALEETQPREAAGGSVAVEPDLCGLAEWVVRTHAEEMIRQDRQIVDVWVRRGEMELVGRSLFVGPHSALGLMTASLSTGDVDRRAFAQGMREQTEVELARKPTEPPVLRNLLAMLTLADDLAESAPDLAERLAER